MIPLFIVREGSEPFPAQKFLEIVQCRGNPALLVAGDLGDVAVVEVERLQAVAGASFFPCAEAEVIRGFEAHRHAGAFLALVAEDAVARTCFDGETAVFAVVEVHPVELVQAQGDVGKVRGGFLRRKDHVGRVGRAPDFFRLRDGCCHIRVSFRYALYVTVRAPLGRRPVIPIFTILAYSYRIHLAMMGGNHEILISNCR